MPQTSPPPRRPSPLVVALAFVVAAIPTVFAVFPEAASAQEVWWRLILIFVWGASAVLIGYRAALRETNEDRSRQLAEASLEARAALPAPEEILRAGLTAAGQQMISLGPLSYYVPDAPDTFKLDVTSAATSPPSSRVDQTASEFLVVQTAWDRQSAVVIEGEPLQAAALVTSPDGVPAGVVYATSSSAAVSSRVGAEIRQAAELIGALLFPAV